MQVVGDKRHKWPQSIRAEIVKIYEEGMSGAELHGETGIAASLIHWWAREKRLKERVKKKVEPSAEKFLELNVRQDLARNTKDLRVCIKSVEIFGFTSSTLIKFLTDAKLL